MAVENNNRQLAFSSRYLAENASLKEEMTRWLRRVSPNAKLQFLPEIFGSGPALLLSGASNARSQRVPSFHQASESLIGVALNYKDPHVAIRHEAIHSLKSLGLFTPSEWGVLSRKSKSTWTAQYRVRDIEEGVAEAFAHWRIDRTGAKGLVKKAFRKTDRFFTRVSNWLHGHGFQSPDDVFERVESGLVGARATPASATTVPPRAMLDAWGDFGAEGARFKSEKHYVPTKVDFALQGGVGRFDVQIEGANVYYFIHQEKNLLDLAVLKVPASRRNQGCATRAMEYLCMQADELGLSMKLAACPLDRRTRPGQLVSFYRRFGFEPTGRSINAVGSPEMVRPATTLHATNRLSNGAFKNWFGNSQAIQPNGAPRVFYLLAADDGIDLPKVGGVFRFSATPEPSEEAGTIPGTNQVPAYLRVERPLVVDLDAPHVMHAMWGDKFPHKISRKVLSEIKSNYDGIMICQAGVIKEAVVFDQRQVKSAIGNTGVFNPLIDDIRYRAGVGKFHDEAAFLEWFADSPFKTAEGAPQVLYHHTQSDAPIDSFVPGGIGASTRGDMYGVGSYFTSSQSSANGYAHSAGSGAIYPVYISGKILDLRDPLSSQARKDLSALANEVSLSEDWGRFSCAFKEKAFDSDAEAIAFFREQKAVAASLGGRAARNDPEPIVMADGRVGVRYVDFTATIEVQTAEEAMALLYSAGYDNVSAMGYDGLLLPREGGDVWAVMYKPDGNVKSAVGNDGSFSRYRADIRYKAASRSTEYLLFNAGEKNGVTFYSAYENALLSSQADAPVFLVEPEGDSWGVSQDGVVVATYSRQDLADDHAHYLSSLSKQPEAVLVAMENPLILPVDVDRASAIKAAAAAAGIVDIPDSSTDLEQWSQLLEEMGYDGTLRLHEGAIVEAMPLSQEQVAGVGYGNAPLLNNDVPAVVFHGTFAPSFETFTDYTGENAAWGPGIYFTSDYKDASGYASKDPYQNIDLPGKIENLASKLGLDYAKSKEMLLHSAQPRVICAQVHLARPFVVGETLLSLSPQAIDVAIAEAGIPEGKAGPLRAQFQKAVDAAAQFSLVSRLGCLQFLRVAASLRGHDGMIIPPGCNPLAKGASHFVAFRREQVVIKGMLPQLALRNSTDIRYKAHVERSTEADRPRHMSDRLEGTKATGADGAPLLLYHGTTNDFHQFEEKQSRSGHPSSALGFFFSASPAVAGMFCRDATDVPFSTPDSLPFSAGANVRPTFLALQNPKTITAKEFREMMTDFGGGAPWIRSREGWQVLRKEFIKQGFDGLKILAEPGSNAYAGSGLEEYKADQYVAFYPGQIVPAFSPDVQEPAPASVKKSRFSDWFDGSAMVGPGGDPATFYHGTAQDFSVFDPLKVGRQSDAGFFGAGFYFTPEPAVAAEYAGTAGAVMPVHLSIKNPYKWYEHEPRSLRENSVLVSAEKTKELKGMGFDGVVVADQYLDLSADRSLTDAQWTALIEASPLLSHIGREKITESLLRTNLTSQVFAQHYGEKAAQLFPWREVIREVVAFDSAQIKSAIGNTGWFSPDNPDIRYKADIDDVERDDIVAAISSGDESAVNYLPESIRDAWMAIRESQSDFDSLKRVVASHKNCEAMNSDKFEAGLNDNYNFGM